MTSYTIPELMPGNEFPIRRNVDYVRRPPVFPADPDDPHAARALFSRRRSPEPGSICAPHRGLQRSRAWRSSIRSNAGTNRAGGCALNQTWSATFVRPARARRAGRLALLLASRMWRIVSGRGPRPGTRDAIRTGLWRIVSDRAPTLIETSLSRSWCAAGLFFAGGAQTRSSLGPPIFHGGANSGQCVVIAFTFVPSRPSRVDFRIDSRAPGFSSAV